MTESRIKALIEEYDFNKVVEFAQELIQIPSLSGNEKKVVQKCITEATLLGFDESYYDKVGNFIGKIKLGNGKGKKIVLSGHLDTVNADPSQWDEDTKPFSASIKDNKLYGRGSSDMKGAFAIMFHAASLLKKLLANDYNGEIYVVGSVVEELFEGVNFLHAINNIKPDVIIIGEASERRVNIAQRGRAEILITVFGKSKHASVGRTTINSIEQVAYIIDAFHRHYKSEVFPLLGKRNIVPTDIKIPVGGGGGIDGRGGNSTVPNKVELTYDVRTIPGDTEETIIELIRKNIDFVVRNAKKRYKDFKDPKIEFAKEKAVTYTGVEISQNKFAPAWKTDENNEIIKKALEGLKKAKLKAEIGAYSFCTDGSAIIKYRELNPDSNTVVFGYGPSKESLAHIVNEYIELEEMHEAFKGYIAIITSLLSE